MGKTYSMPRIKIPTDSELPWTGERYVPGVSAELEMEHLHRYLAALDICVGKDVLDIACGEGYGAYILAQVAESVVGVDIDKNSVVHANEVYVGDNLSFRVGSCAEIPLADNSFDVVVSFETLEHIGEHDHFIMEVKRVLRTDGCLVISTPDKITYSPPGTEPNPHHLRELDKKEFTALLKRYFKKYSLVGQRTAFGSLIASEAKGRVKGPASSSLTFFRKCSRGQVSVEAALPQSLYLIAVASDVRAPALRNGVFEGDVSVNALSALQGGIAARDAKIEQVRGELEAEHKRAAERDERLERVVEELAVVQAGKAEREAGIEALSIDLKAAQQKVASRDAELERVQGELAAAQATVAERDAKIEQVRGELEAEHKRVAERDKRLERVVGQLAAAQGTMAERDARLQAVYASTSWRITAPMRAVKRGMLAALRLPHYARVLLGKTARAVYYRLPLSHRNKQRLKSFVYRNFGFLIKNTATYKYWLETQAQFKAHSGAPASGVETLVPLNEAARERQSQLAEQLDQFTKKILPAEYEELKHSLPQLFSELAGQSSRTADGEPAEILEGMTLRETLEDLRREPERSTMLFQTKSSGAEEGQIGKLQILIVAGMFPSFFHAGGLRLFDIILELTKRHSVDLYAVYRPDLDRQSLEVLKPRLRSIRLVRDHRLQPTDILEWLKRKGKGTHSYDVIQFEYLNSAPLISPLRDYGKRLGFTMQECMTRRYAIDLCRALSDRPGEAAKIMIEMLVHARLEKQALLNSDFSIALTPEDAQFAERLSGFPARVVPTGISNYMVLDRLKETPARDMQAPIPNSAAYIGYFDHYANVDAVKWYLNNVHFRVLEEIPDYLFFVIGAGDIAAFQQMYLDEPSIIFVGRVDDIIQPLRKARICLSPLVSGAGIRGKINQYSAVGRPTVSTTIGISGTPYVNNESVVVADTPEAFAEGIQRLLSDEAYSKKIQEGARKVMEDHFHWSAIIKRLEKIYNGQP